MSRHTPALLTLYALTIGLGCENQESVLEVDTLAPALDVLDATPPAGNPDFYWLPPLAPEATMTGDPDDTLEPVVRICSLSGQTCFEPFTTAGGPGSDWVRFEPEDGHYVVNWRTKQFELAPGDAYRIEVSVAGTRLGFADVMVVGEDGSGWMPTGGAVPINNGRTLPIKFRIDKGAVFVVGPEGGTVTALDGAVTLEVPAGAISGAVGFTVWPAPDLPSPDHILDELKYKFGPSPYSFHLPLTVKLRYHETTLPSGVTEDQLRLFKQDGDSWEVVLGSRADPVGNIIRGELDHFSETAGGILQEQEVLEQLYETTNGPNWTKQDGWTEDDTDHCTWYKVVCDPGTGMVTALNLFSNNLAGFITPMIGELSSLVSLDLRHNRLNLSIPSEMGDLTSLETLDLSHNKLEGDVPSSMGNLRALRSLNLGGNLLEGGLAELFEQWTVAGPPALEELHLDQNQFKGDLPEALGGLPNLWYLNVSQNGFTKLPSTLGDLTNLRYLLANGNELSGPFPQEVLGLAALESLGLGQNLLTEEIPDLGALKNLRGLRLGHNDFTGEIPASLEELTDLQGLFLSSNQLEGEIPKFLGDLTNLQYLDLSGNRLTGSIPEDLGNLDNLRILGLTANLLEGLVPVSVAELGGRIDAMPDPALCSLALNPVTLFMPWTLDYVRADEDHDGYICGLRIRVGTGSIRGLVSAHVVGKLHPLGDLPVSVVGFSSGALVNTDQDGEYDTGAVLDWQQYVVTIRGVPDILAPKDPLLVTVSGEVTQDFTFFPKSWGTVTVHVTVDNELLEGVSVNLTAGGFSHSEISGSSDPIDFPYVPVGNYELTISGFPSVVDFAFTSVSGSIDEPDQLRSVRFEGSDLLTAATITGTVTTEGVGLRDVEVVLTGPEGTVHATTGVDGTYSASHLTPGDWEVSLPQFGLIGLSKSVTVPEGATVDVSFSVPSTGATITGTVSSAGNPLPGVDVVLVGPGGHSGMASTTTGTDGRYSVNDLVPGIWRVSLPQFGISEWVTVAEGDTVEVNISVGS